MEVDKTAHGNVEARKAKAAEEGDMTEEERIHALEVFTDMVENPMTYVECKEEDLRIAIEALKQVRTMESGVCAKGYTNKPFEM